jgi:hypothetical protein
MNHLLCLLMKYNENNEFRHLCFEDE